MSEAGSDAEREAPQDISSPQVAEKCKIAADITNAALRCVLSKVVPGADILELCILGDAFIVNETKKVFQKKDRSKRKIEKGIAVPTSICVNDIFANNSPCDRASSRILKRGDLVSVDLGAHIDGYVGTAAYTVVCCCGNPTTFGGSNPTAVADALAAISTVPSASDEMKQQQLQAEQEGSEALTTIEGSSATVLKACWAAAEAALRKIEVGGKASAVTKVICDVANEFKCCAMQGVFCHQLKQHVIEGSRCFPIAAAVGEEKTEDFAFEANEVYAVDVVLSTGEGKAREADVRPSIFRRAVERKYILKSQLGRAFMSQVENNFLALPFSLRQVVDERACKVGVAEAMRHELLTPYPVMLDKNGELTAQFKFTVQLTSSGLKKVTGLPFVQERQLKAPEIRCELIKALLATSLNPKKNKKKTREETAKAEGQAS